MSSVTVTENNNKVSVNKTTNVVTVTSPGTVGPQGGSGTIESATATATEVAVSGAGVSGDPTVSVTLGGTASARTMAFAFGVPTGASGAIGSIVTTGTDGINIDSGGTMNSFASTIQLGINAQTLWSHILGASVTGDALTVSDGSNTSPIPLEGTITFSPVANETTVVENAGTVTIGLVDDPTVSGDLTVTGDLTVSGTTTTVNTTVTVSDAVVVNNAGSDIGLKVNSTSTGHIMQLQDDGSDVLVVADGGTTTGTFAGPLTGAVTGNASTATALATARTIGGVSFDGTANINLPGVNATGNQDTSGTATTATNVTVADESSDTTCFPLFVTAATGGLPPRSGTNLTFNSSTGILTATGFAGPITGAVTGNAATATALATGRTIGMTGDVVWTSASFDGSGNVTGTATIQANSVTMGTDTTGDYTATITAGTGLTSTGATSGEGIAHSLSVDASQTQITSVGALNAGSITSGFGAIDTGSSNITTTGTVSATTFVGALTGTASGNDVLGSAVSMAIALG